MNTEVIRKTTGKLGQAIARNSPTILTGLSVAGLVSTVILAVRATPKAMTILEEEMYDRQPCGVKLTKMEAVKLTWKYYIPAAVMGGVTIGCIIGANSIHLRRNAALASVYSITEATLKEYRSKVIETIGEKKEKAIKDEIHKDRVKNHPVKDSEVILTNFGETLCYDSISGRYFKSDIEKIRKVQNDLNSKLIHSMYISLNELYDALGLSSIKMGEDLGWVVEDGMMEFDFSSQLTENGTPCLVLDYSVNPKSDYGCSYR